MNARPDLPGCVAAAPTLDETEKLIREAIAFHLEGIREDGDDCIIHVTLSFAAVASPDGEAAHCAVRFKRWPT